MLEMIHELVRHELAEAVLAARPSPGGLRAFGVIAKTPDRVDHVPHPLPRRRRRFHDRRPPFRRAIRVKGQVRFDGRHEPLGAFTIGLVHHEDVGDFHDAGLQRLHLVAGAGHKRHNRHVGGADDVHFILADADRLDDDDLLSGGVEQQRRVTRRPGEAAQMAARRHAPDEDPLVGGVCLHAKTVAQHGAAGEGTRWIDRNHANRRSRFPGRR